MKGIPLLVILGTLAVHGAAQSPSVKTMYITAESVEVKANPSFFSGIRGTVTYGEPVRVLREQGKWAEVQRTGNPALQGWVALNCLTSRRIIRSGSAATAEADELALAGKGFNREVEAAYKYRGGLNYTALDVLEIEPVSSSQLLDFLREGRLEQGDR